MTKLAPELEDSHFFAIKSDNESQIQKTFGPWVKLLHAFLNQLDCVEDLQEMRRGWVSRTKYQDAFGTFSVDPHHWYTFNHGGRNEAQFNLGLNETYFRVGLGFEFTLKKGGDPTSVHLAYTCFVDELKKGTVAFREIVDACCLEVEFVAKGSNQVEIIDTPKVVDWLLDLPQEPSWIFVGRLLRRDADQDVLADRIRLGGVIQSVFSDLRPIWLRTQLRAAKFR